MPSLYRKYRPQTFQEVVGQSHIVKTLQNALAHDRVGHAYLFCGPRGTGKTTIARLLAKELKSAPMDIIEIDAASNRGIDEVRELKEKVQTVPANSTHKVFIVDEVHMLTKEAFNALLKTLEEPPGHVVFVLATTEPDKVIDTIISRTQRFDFHKVTTHEITALLLEIADKESITLEQEAARMIAVHSEGAVRDALSLLEQLMYYDEKSAINIELVQEVLGLPEMEAVQEIISNIHDGNIKKALSHTEDMAERGVDFYLFLTELVQYARNVLIEKISPDILKESLPLSEAQQNVFLEHVRLFDKKEVMELIGHLLKAREETRVSPVAQLPLELALVKAIHEESASVPNEEPEEPAQPKQEKAEDETTEPSSDINKDDDVRDEVMNNVEPTEVALEVASVIQRWGEALATIKKKNFAIGGFMRSSVPVEVKDDVLVLACKFGFHRDKIVDMKNRAEIESVIEELFGMKLAIECVLEEDLTEDQKKRIKEQHDRMESDFEQTAMSMFEGKVVTE